LIDAASGANALKGEEEEKNVKIKTFNQQIRSSQKCSANAFKKNKQT
jgi:hypothetical protein